MIGPGGWVGETTIIPKLVKFAGFRPTRTVVPILVKFDMEEYTMASLWQGSWVPLLILPILQRLGSPSLTSICHHHHLRVVKTLLM